MIDGGGLAWKWTRKWVPPSESRLAVSACEWPAGWPWPGRAPSAERVRGTTSVWRAGVVRDLYTTRHRIDWWLLSLFDHRSSTVPCADSLLQPPRATRSQSRSAHIVPIPIGAAIRSLRCTIASSSSGRSPVCGLDSRPARPVSRPVTQEPVTTAYQVDLVVPGNNHVLHYPTALLSVH